VPSLMHSISHWMNKLMRVVFLLLVLLSSVVGCSNVPASQTPVTSSIVATDQQPDSQQPKQQDEFVPISQLPPQDQLPAAPLLVTAYAFVWVALFGYLVSVARRLSKVQREVDRLESDIAKGTRT
jgi:CcmD family protein